MFDELERINARPRPFEFYTASDLWTDEHTSRQMLACHLNDDIDLSSRNAAFIKRSVAWIVSRFNVGPGTKIADFGCGPGLYTTPLAKTGAAVTGIDFSKRSIDYAQETAEQAGLSIRYVNQDYLEYAPQDRFDLILMIYCDFCALSPAQRAILLNKFRAALEPGGRILFDVCSLAAFDQRAEGARYEINLQDGFWSPKKYHGFANTFKYEAEKVLLEKYTLIEAARTRVVYNWLQHFSRESLTREIVDCGLAVEEFYANVAGAPFDPAAGEFAVVARL